jgi:hypothetical protein
MHTVHHVLLVGISGAGAIRASLRCCQLVLLLLLLPLLQPLPLPQPLPLSQPLPLQQLLLPLLVWYLSMVSEMSALLPRTGCSVSTQVCT